MTPSPGPRVRVAAIIQRRGRILLVSHEKDGQTYWLLPGGGVDFGESIAEALVREVWEETGLPIALGDVVLVNDSIAPDAHRHQINLYFTATCSEEAAPEPQTADKRLTGASFVPIDQLEELDLRPDIRVPLRRLLHGDGPLAPRYLGNIWKP